MNTVQAVNRLHDQAMEYTGQSFRARRYGDRERYLHFTRLALEKEAAAADLMAELTDIEPTRSVLHRSAATLAWRCEEYDYAKRLIFRGLDGNPPGEIAWELKDLLSKVKEALADDSRCRATQQTISKVGVLKSARANGIGECDLHTDDAGKWTIEVPQDIMNQVLGAYFNKRVEVEGKRMKKTRLLQRIRLESIAHIRAAEAG